MSFSYTYALGIISATLVFVFVFEFLRRGYLKEKYAALWIFVSGVMLVIAVFPQVVNLLAGWLGVQVPANLLFFLTALLLLIVSVQLSFELSKGEAKVRRLAEEVGLLSQRVHELTELSRRTK